MTDKTRLQEIEERVNADLLLVSSADYRRDIKYLLSLLEEKDREIENSLNIIQQREVANEEHLEAVYQQGRVDEWQENEHFR